MTGPRCVLVGSSSAIHGRSGEDEPCNIQALNRTHSELVKFSSNDVDYTRVLAVLKRMASAAVKAIPRRRSSIEDSED